MIRIALLAAGLSLAACTPSTEPAPAQATTEETTTPIAPVADNGMPPTDASAIDASQPNLPASNPAPADGTQMPPADATSMPKRASDPATGVSQPAPPPIEDPAPTPPPTH